MAKSRDPSHAAASACYCTTLRKASRAISKIYDAALAPTGLKSTQRAILAELRRSGPLRVSELADTLVMDPGGLAHTLKPLQRDGLLELVPDPADRRSRLVTLLKAGLRKLEEGDPLWAEAQARFEATVGTGESRALRKLLRVAVADSVSGSKQS